MYNLSYYEFLFDGVENVLVNCVVEGGGFVVGYIDLEINKKVNLYW